MFTDVIHWCPVARDACFGKVVFASCKDSSKKPVFSCVFLVVSESWNECAI